MWRRVGLDKNNVSEEHVASVFRVERIRELDRVLAIWSANAVPSSGIFSTLKMEETRSFETSLLTRSTGHHIPEDGILHNHDRETSHLT
jgi:hypothetical protein